MKRIGFLLLLLLVQRESEAGTLQTAKPEKLKILMVVWSFPKLSETFVVNQIIGLLSKGHDVKILALTHKGQRESVVNKDILTHNLMQRVITGIPYDLSTYDVVISQFGNIGIEIDQYLKKVKGKKPLHITFFRGYDISAFLTKRPNAYKNLLKNGDLFIAECDFFRKRLISLGTKPEKCLVHYSSIQTSKFQYKTPALSNDGTVKLITVSRLVEKKGVDDALCAAQKIMALYPQVRYTIIGEGPLKARLINLAHHLGIAQKVNFVGFKEPQEVAIALNNHHIFLLPCVVASNNNIDGVPTVIKEAMASGLPVISTYVSGIPEILENGKSGFLVQPHDISGLVDKTGYLLQHPELWEPMGKSGRAFVEEKCDIEVLNNELESILHSSVLKNRNVITKK